MVYNSANQTTRYPAIKPPYITTNEHFHDNPTSREPSKTSTFGKLYDHSTYFMDRKLDPKIASRSATTGGGASQLTATRYTDIITQPLTWSGRLSSSSYVGDGSFQLANGLTYSFRSGSAKPVKLVPYADLQKTEYQDRYNRGAAAAEHPRWVSGRAPHSVEYKSSGRFSG
ncbi:hypothetical protein TSOC_013171 [Tetrabaena socialis]|uniref:Uncharacterized protein n=1 Tax=Tetrabaena socialis TaxID=47790 RepID=A0A2J7ZL53_9CHLO|nr:hypothetical protein TSOC_013171 [Tetrabaena socialis]|eukprot:PNH00980.1 hypothetical protein TSOC_013171 [Tetrabaena socialis]